MDTPDVADPEFWNHDPDPALAELRRQCPVAPRADGRFWTVAAHDDIVAISKDPASYTSSKGVLIGDLNAGPEHPDIARLLATPGVVGTNGAKPPAELPGRVEWVIAKGLKPLDATRCDNGASDHPRVALEVATPR